MTSFHIIEAHARTFNFIFCLSLLYFHWEKRKKRENWTAFAIAWISNRFFGWLPEFEHLFFEQLWTEQISSANFEKEKKQKGLWECQKCLQVLWLVIGEPCADYRPIAFPPSPPPTPLFYFIFCLCVSHVISQESGKDKSEREKERESLRSALVPQNTKSWR